MKSKENKILIKNIASCDKKRKDTRRISVTTIIFHNSTYYEHEQKIFITNKSLTRHKYLLLSNKDVLTTPH